MEAGICSCDYGGESPEFFDQREVKARKERRCCECGDLIHSGARYQYTVGKWDGGVEAYHTCLICARVRSDFCAPFGDLWAVLAEALGREILGPRKGEEG